MTVEQPSPEPAADEPPDPDVPDPAVPDPVEDVAPWWKPEPDEHLLWTGTPAYTGSVEEPADRFAIAGAAVALVAGVGACIRIGSYGVVFAPTFLPALIGGFLVAAVMARKLFVHRKWLRQLEYVITDRRIIIAAGAFERAWRHDALPRPFAVPRAQDRADIVFGVFSSAATERELRSYLDAGTDELRVNPWPVLLRLDLDTADRLVAAYA